MFILKQEGSIFNDRHIGEDDVKAMLQNKDIDIKYMKKDDENNTRK